MRIKDLYKHNAVVVLDEGVRKTVRMPLAVLSRLCSRHEARALQALEALGFAHAPRLLCQQDNVLLMTRIAGSGLDRRHVGDVDLFASLVSCIERLHALGFAHGNLTRDNVLSDDHREIYLIDFETHCGAGNPLFPLMKLWDYARLYRISQRVFRLRDDQVRAVFPRQRGWLVPVVGPVYALCFVIRRSKRRLRGRRA